MRTAGLGVRKEVTYPVMSARQTLIENWGEIRVAVRRNGHACRLQTVPLVHLQVTGADVRASNFRSSRQATS